MNELGPEARSLLEASRGAEALAPPDRDRIKRGVLMRLAVLGAATTATTATGGAAAMSLATKLTLVGIAVAVLGGGSVSLWVWKGRPAAPVAAHHDSTASSQPSQPSQPVGAAPSTAPAMAANAQEAPAPDPRRRDGAKSTRRPTNVGAPANGSVGSSPAESLDPELTVLRQAQEDLRAGLPAQAMRRLADFDQQFGKGVLGQERQAVAAVALCQARPGPAAQARAEQFLRSAPESPLAERVRSACKKPKGVAGQTSETEPSREP